MKIKKFSAISRASVSIVIGAMFSSGVNAQVIGGGAHEFEAEFAVSPQTVDNAFGVPSGQEKTRETQTEYSASLLSAWQTELTQIDIDYRYSETKYNKDSQQEGTFREGESAFIFGNDDSYYQFSADHSIRRVLRQPNVIAIDLSNSEERQITNLSPLLRARFGSATSLAIAYNYSDIDFEDSESDNSSRDDVRLILHRDVSAISDVRVTAGARDVDFDTSDNADYSLDYMSFGVDVALRWFSYAIEVGYSELTPEVGDKESSSTFDFTLLTEIVGNRFELFAQKSVSDSSLGNANDSFFAEEVTFDGSQDARDQVVRTAAGLSWEYEYLCVRCSLTASVGGEEVEYFNLSENDATEIFYDLGFSYEFSSRTTISIGHRQSESKFSSASSTLEDSSSDVSTFEFTYQLTKDVELRFSHEQDARDTGTAGTVRVNTTGLTARYLYD